MKELKIMRIGSGKETKEGKRVKIYGYAHKVGKSLSELLKTEGVIKLVALGDAPGNNALKAIAHAKNLLKLEGKDLNVRTVDFEDVELTREGTETIIGRAVTTVVELVIE